MDVFLDIFHRVVYSGIIMLLLFQSTVLFLRSKNHLARKTMAILELLWGIGFLFEFINMYTANPEAYSLFREKVLIAGNLFISFTVFLPMQVFLPGWLNWKRVFGLISPIILMIVFYYGGMYLLDEVPEDLYSYSMLFQSIGHFNVWFRFVMLFSCMLYFVYIMKKLLGYEQLYIQWKNENFADQDYVDVSWMHYYTYMMVGTFIFYAGILFIGGRIIAICYGLYIIICFSYLSYKILFFESPYPEDFLSLNANEMNMDQMINDSDWKSQNKLKENRTVDETFEKRIQTYKISIEKWMEKEKPYLFRDFKLTDVARILPINRSYISRVFNQGFGKNFSEVVRDYRIAFSKELIKQDVNLPNNEIAELSGFHSVSSFIHAFKLVTGITPNQFKLHIKESE